MKKEDLDSKKLKVSTTYTKICSICGITKIVDHFRWKVTSKRLSAECRDCANNRDNSRYSSSIHVYVKMLIKNLISDCKKGKRKELFNLNLESFLGIWKKQFIKFGISCPYSGIDMTFKRGEGRIGSNASIDRFDSTLGYMPGNVVFCSNLANMMKSDMSFEEFLDQCKKIAANKVDHLKIKRYMQSLQGLRTMDHGPEDD